MSQFNPNPHELDFSADLAVEMGLAPSGAKRAKYTVSTSQRNRVRAAVKALFQTPSVRAMSQGQRATLRSQIRSLFARIDKHVSKH